MLFRNNTILPFLSLLSLAAACGGNDEKPIQGCELGDSSGCEGGQVCEQVESSQPACFAPLLLRGRVLDSETTKGVASARVVARDVNGELVSRDVAISDADGRYALSIPTPRKQDGTPIVAEALLRADAKGHATFPSGLRVALPVDTSAPRKEATAWVVENGSTDVSLDPLTETEKLGSVSGRVEAAAAPGTLVVAGQKSSIAGRDGTFEIFDVAAGAVEVRGYKSGLQLEPAAAEVPSGGAVKGLVLKESTAALGSVSGDVNFVNAGTQQTSVVLVVESTFNEALARGEVPIGLRQFPVTGHYSFTGVPLGDYVVLAAFENDALVRDPDTSIGGTAIQHVRVDSGAVSVPGFKVTGALAVTEPGAEQAEVIEGTPTFVWEDDSSEDGYEVVVHDTFGNEVWRDTEVPRVTGSATVSLPYGGPALERGYYQFRAISYRDDAKGNTTGRVYISATEDLKGVFIIR